MIPLILAPCVRHQLSCLSTPLMVLLILFSVMAHFALLIFMSLLFLMFLTSSCSCCQPVRSLITIVVSFLNLTLVLFRIVVRGPWLVLAAGSVILLVSGSSTGFTFLQLPLPLDASPAPLLMLLLLLPPLPSALLSGIIG